MLDDCTFRVCTVDDGCQLCPVPAIWTVQDFCHSLPWLLFQLSSDHTGTPKVAFSHTPQYHFLCRPFVVPSLTGEVHLFSGQKRSYGLSTQPVS